jgi:hypothetical protein
MFSHVYRPISQQFLFPALCTIFTSIISVTNQSLIQEEIKSRLNSGNACYYSVQNLSSSRLVSKNVKIRIYKTRISPMVLHGCETWSLTLREKHRLKSVWELGAEENTWTEKGCSDRRLKKTV